MFGPHKDPLWKKAYGSGLKSYFKPRVYRADRIKRMKKINQEEQREQREEGIVKVKYVSRRTFLCYP